MAGPKTYTRPMDGWWRRSSFYRSYLARELTSVLVTLYALILLYGLLQLTRGEAAYEAWRAALASPTSIVLHGVVLAAFFYHAWSWFEVMPKTMPFVRIGARRVPDGAIVAAGAAAAAVCSALLFFAVWWVTR